MKIFTRSLLVAISVIVISYIVGGAVLSVYDSRTRRGLLDVVSRELPSDASMSQMDTFMRRHTVRYDLDKKYNSEFEGILAQTSLDKALFDRKISLTLRFDARRETFTTASVRIYYTFL
jgi:hypothetical protein